MRIRRNILAPAILTLGTVGSLVAGPVLALTTTAAPATAAVAVGHASRPWSLSTAENRTPATARRRFPESAAGRFLDAAGDSKEQS